MLIVVGVLCAVAFGLGVQDRAQRTVPAVAAGAKYTMPNLVVPARIFAIVVGVAVAAAGSGVSQGFLERAMKWIVALDDRLRCLLVPVLVGDRQERHPA